METKTEVLKVSPPGLIPSIIAGFNAVATHIYLILVPVAVDLFLWFGPHLSIRELMLPAIQEALQSISSVAGQGVIQNVQAAQELWQDFLSRFNLFTAIRTFPVGLPSLMIGQGSDVNPLGQPAIFELNSLGSAFLTLVVIFLVGITLGGLYFWMIARSTANQNQTQFSIGQIGWQTLQSLLLTLILLAIVLLFSLPGSLLIGIFVWISPGLAQLALFILVVVLLWFLVPLLFSPHGIFVNQLNAVNSIMTSVRMVRYYLPGTGLFLLAMLVISNGLDLLWRVPATNSWMTLVGILGHAFIYTSLLAASFFYYRGGFDWMQANLQRFRSTGPHL